MKRSIMLASLCGLAACTAISNVETRDDGHLIVTSRARISLVSWNHVRRLGLKHAAAYCDRTQQRLHVISVHTDGVWGVTSQSVTVEFDCV